MNDQIKKNAEFGVILLTEYHASSIRLWRGVLLRSDIRLTPSEYFAKGEIPLRELERRIEYH